MTLHPNTKTPHAMPAAARTLGLAGVVPFAGLALLIAFNPEIKAEAAAALLIYGAVVLSFLGGVRCGFAVLEGGEAGWSGYGLCAVPSLAAWLAALWSGPAGLLILALSLALWYAFEYSAPPAIVLPAWYLRLRAPLTAVAVLSLIFAAVSW